MTVSLTTGLRVGDAPPWTEAASEIRECAKARAVCIGDDLPPAIAAVKGS